MKFNEQQQKYYASLHSKARRNRKTVREMLEWLENNYTGDTRKAIRHQMGSESWKTTVELQLRIVYKNVLKIA